MEFIITHGNSSRFIPFVGTDPEFMECKVCDEIDVRNSVYVMVCSRMNCIGSDLTISTLMRSSFFVMRKGSGEISLLQNETIVLQKQVSENQPIELSEMTDQADTLLLTCTASRECIYELWKNGTHRQSFVTRNKRTTSISLILSPSLISTTEVIGFEGDTLPTIFWTVPHSIRSVTLTSLFTGYRLNEQENCLQGAIVPFQPSSHSVEVTVSCEQETLQLESIVTIHGKFRLVY